MNAQQIDQQKPSTDEMVQLLLVASRYGWGSVVKLLLRHYEGADEVATEGNAFQIACEYGHVEVAKALLDYGRANCDLDDYLLRACLYGRHDIVALLLPRGADIHANNDEALRLACKNGHIEVAEMLLAHGANVHADNEAPLRSAYASDHHGLVNVLLAHGAQPLPDMAITYESKLDLAVKWAKGRGLPRMVEMLKSHIAKGAPGKKDEQ